MTRTDHVTDRQVRAALDRLRQDLVQAEGELADLLHADQHAARDRERTGAPGGLSDSDRLQLAHMLDDLAPLLVSVHRRLGLA